MYEGFLVLPPMKPTVMDETPSSSNGCSMVQKQPPAKVAVSSGVVRLSANRSAIFMGSISPDRLPPGKWRRPFLELSHLVHIAPRGEPAVGLRRADSSRRRRSRS